MSDPATLAAALVARLYLLGDAGPPEERRALPHGLTAREAVVLRLIAAGRTNREIAGALSLSVLTVQRHLANAYAKIGARGRADAVAYALRHGLAAADEN